MANLFSHPFSLDGNGKVILVDQDSDQYLSERLAILIQTRPGERPLAPSLGMNDPVFDELSAPELDFQIEMFELPITVTEIHREDISDGTATYEVVFERSEANNEEDEDDE